MCTNQYLYVFRVGANSFGLVHLSDSIFIAILIYKSYLFCKGVANLQPVRIIEAMKYE